MDEGKQGVMVAAQNPIAQLQARFKDLENGFRAWGAAIGAFMGTLTNDATSAIPTPPQANLSPQAMASFKQAQALAGGPLVQARNFAVMTGVNAGISCVMKRIRGKEDVQSR
ncbi:hypothetical protein CK203_049315 [Vitis vinifera]|uniref:Mitochondrial import inner membrane translocase subunit TIM22 n=1 Tax=Vitis vinifera TaxID=29760 RepID=A0A438FLR9_VITVI|nr:hypothetical protein CK203_049315 [Vitis vinifera]